MTKAKSVGEKKRAKKNRPDTEKIEREPNGRASRKGLQYQIPKEKQEAAKRVVLSARARHLGKEQSRAMLDIVDRPWMGCAAGVAIADEPDVSDLWQTIKDIRRLRASYLRAIAAPDEHAHGAMLTVMPEKFEARDDDGPIDLRTEEERARSAIAAWEGLVSILWDKDPLLLRFVDQVVVLNVDAPGPLAQILRLIQAGMARK